MLHFKVLKYVFLTSCIIIYSFGIKAFAVSSQMERVQVDQCSSTQCVQLNLKKGFIASSGNSLSAKNCRLTVRTMEHLKKRSSMNKERINLKTYDCETCRYDFSSQFLICNNLGADNQETDLLNKKSTMTQLKRPQDRAPSFTMDANLNLKPF